MAAGTDPLAIVEPIRSGKAYTVAQAARLAQTTSSNVRRWVLGYSAPGHKMKPVFGQKERPEGEPLALSFLELAELIVVAHFRKGSGRRYPLHPSKSNSWIKLGTLDKDWIPWAGDNGWLVFSQNYHLLENEDELKLLVKHRGGIVFTKSGQYTTGPLMQMIMRRWDWLVRTDRSSARPFAFRVG